MKDRWVLAIVAGKTWTKNHVLLEQSDPHIGTFRVYRTFCGRTEESANAIWAVPEFRRDLTTQEVLDLTKDGSRTCRLCARKFRAVVRLSENLEGTF